MVNILLNNAWVLSIYAHLLRLHATSWIQQSYASDGEYISKNQKQAAALTLAVQATNVITEF